MVDKTAKRTLPPHVVHLARAVYDGEKVEPLLADALDEMGLPLCAAHFRGEDGDHEPGRRGRCQTARWLARNDAPADGVFIVDQLRELTRWFNHEI